MASPKAWVFYVSICIYSWYILKAVLIRLSASLSMRKNRCQPPPKYPHKFPFLGMDLVNELKRNVKDGNTLDQARQRFERFGKTFAANVMGKRIIYTMDAKNIQTVASLEFEKFAAGPLRRAATPGWLGNGVFMTDGRAWAHGRGILKPLFKKAQREELDAFEKHVGRMIHLIPRDDGSIVDLQVLFKKLFLDVSTELLFGKSTESLASDSHALDAKELISSFEDALRGIGMRLKQGPWERWFGNTKEWQNLVAKNNLLIDNYVSNALERRESAMETGIKQKPSEKPISFLDQLVYETQDRIFLRDQLSNVFIAAYDTVAIGASDVFFILARHPDVWVKLRAEVLRIEHPLTHRRLKSVKYLTWVVDECFRLLGPAHMSSRTCVSDCVLPHGGGKDGMSPILVTRGQQVNSYFGAAMMDKDLWGENADQFCPERWEKMHPQWEYAPFLEGPRICPAQQIVKTQIRYLIVRMMMEFERMDNRDPVISFVEEHKITKQSRNGVKVSFISSHGKAKVV